jgi:hypothetical protein
MDMDFGCKLGAVVGLDHLDPERQFGQQVVEELDGGLLIASRVDPEHSQAGAVVDGGELVEAFPGSSNGGYELDVDLDPVTGLGFLIPLPTFLICLVLLGGRFSSSRFRIRHSPDVETSISWYRFRYIEIFAGPKW